jgi:hypothetical protein
MLSRESVDDNLRSKIPFQGGFMTPHHVVEAASNLFIDALRSQFRLTVYVDNAIPKGLASKDTLFLTLVF